jgi:hypothetical protein
VPHPAIGGARRMQVLDPSQQHKIMVSRPGWLGGWVGGRGRALLCWVGVLCNPRPERRPARVALLTPLPLCLALIRPPPALTPSALPPALPTAQIEAVENHMPEVVIVDEIGTEAEALACRTIAERGVQVGGCMRCCCCTAGGADDAACFWPGWGQPGSAASVESQELSLARLALRPNLAAPLPPACPPLDPCPCSSSAPRTASCWRTLSRTPPSATWWAASAA